MPLAHVAGLPAEEMLAAGPALLAGGGLFAAWARAALRAAWTRAADVDPARPCGSPDRGRA